MVNVELYNYFWWLENENFHQRKKCSYVIYTPQLITKSVRKLIDLKLELCYSESKLLNMLFKTI